MPRAENKTIEEMYLSRVVRRDGGECWGWSGCIEKSGYAVFNKSGEGKQYAHRIAYRLHIGEIPDGKEVMHLCHNPACSNPAHLALGDRKENVRTSFEVGRLQRKIPLGALPEMRHARAAGVTLKAIGERFGCTKQAVRHMLNSHPEIGNA